MARHICIIRIIRVIRRAFPCASRHTEETRKRRALPYAMARTIAHLS